jgi:hypothetical protein
MPVPAVTLAQSQAFETITMVPLFAGVHHGPSPGYLTLDEALHAGSIEITETSAQGSVNELKVFNTGSAPVFILDGEELVGAKQNRVVNLSILVPAGAALTIPVSCVEAGRWRARSRAFSAAPRTQYAAGRAKRMAQVTASMRASGERRSNQAEVWADIASKAERMAARSPTSAMEEIFAVHAGFADRAVEAFRPLDGQCGALFLIDGEVVGFDLFDRPETLRRLLPKLVRAVAVDALDRRGVPQPQVVRKLDRRQSAVAPPRAEDAAAAFLEAVRAAERHETPALGLGRDVRLAGDRISGAALHVDGALVHVSAFQL